MATKPTVLISSTGSQSANRYLDTFTDQHRSSRFPDGRPWWGWREYAANKGDHDGFVGGDLMPGDHLAPKEGQWSAPFMPEAQFFEFNYHRRRITIRYDKMLAHDKAAYDAYYQAAAKICHQNSWPEVRYGSMPRHAVTALIGEPPRSPKIAQAAQAGDRWLLGATDEVNEELARLLGLSRQGLEIVRDEIAPVAKPEEVLTMTPDALQKLIAQEVAKAVANQPKRKHRRVNPLPAEDAKVTLPAGTRIMGQVVLPRTDVATTSGKVA